MKKIKIKRSRRRGVGNGGFVVVICTSQNPFDNRSLSLVSHDPSNDQGPRPSTCRLTYQFHNVHHSTYEYMSTSYHHELSVQDAQSYVHPPTFAAVFGGCNIPSSQVTCLCRLFNGKRVNFPTTFDLSSLLCLKHI